jgi:hypothetical protein
MPTAEWRAARQRKTLHRVVLDVTSRSSLKQGTAVAAGHLQGSDSEQDATESDGCATPEKPGRCLWICLSSLTADSPTQPAPVRASCSAAFRHNEGLADSEGKPLLCGHPETLHMPRKAIAL